MKVSLMLILSKTFLRRVELLLVLGRLGKMKRAESSPEFPERLIAADLEQTFSTTFRPRANFISQHCSQLELLTSKDYGIGYIHAAKWDEIRN